MSLPAEMSNLAPDLVKLFDVYAEVSKHKPYHLDSETRRFQGVFTHINKTKPINFAPPDFLDYILKEAVRFNVHYSRAYEGLVWTIWFP